MVKGSDGPRRWDYADLHPSDAEPVKNPSDRIFGAPFTPAGWIVLFVTAVVAGIELSLLVFLLRI
ncbi:hypothetical protein FRB94_005350 [Tulasnella sp. JGI-2019a]|nr:hypothetical protein FRB93_001948 [Tulasnella sp. JGI-2019a]KAG9000561.1 hypothetical protein FRB94_005350 [Tulasnella sp. JGI-2019a]